MDKTRENQKSFPKPIFREISELRNNILKFKSVDIVELCGEDLNSKNHNTQKIKLKPEFRITVFFAVIVSCLTFGLINFNLIVEYLLSIRCLLPNNYLIYEACRPIDSNCKFCANVIRPIILNNLTQAEFSVKLQSTSQHIFITVSFNFLIYSQRYAYLPQPIIIKNACLHWPARELTFEWLKEVYNKWPDALNRSDECQFLPFKSAFGSLSEFFNEASEPESQNRNGKPPWYVGFSNCNPNILKELRELYPRPAFLPASAEIPNTDYTFLGYEEGAVMHVSSIIYVYKCTN